MEFVKALKMKPTVKNDGYVEDDNNIVTWCIGHLVTLSYPEVYNENLKRWKLETLPFLPDKFKYEIIGSVKKQYGIVKKLLNNKEVANIYYSGDSAREGEYIQRLVRQEAGYNKSAKEYRVWIDSQTEEEILRGIKEAKELAFYDNLSDSAYARAIEDYEIGINFSRILSIKYANLLCNCAGIDNKPIAVGRVMSCVLGMIVNRERIVRNAKEIPYYGIQGNIGDLETEWRALDTSDFYNSQLLFKDNGFIKQVDAEKLIEQLNINPVLTLKSNITTQEKKKAPLLFNLAELQSECSKKFKISPDETLQVAQYLYEKKLTTYPRTDARVLTTAICKVIHKNISGVAKLNDFKNAATDILNNNLHNNIINTKYVNDALVSDHYAIIPTGTGFEAYNTLGELEKNVYSLIVKRFLSVFLPDAIYEKVSCTFKNGKEPFYLSASCLKDAGWSSLYGNKKDSSSESYVKNLQAMQENKDYDTEFELHISKTAPPKRYNSGAIILAMENAGQLIEEEELREQIKGSGIGTSATRAEVIKKLCKNNYISINKKTQVITPTDLGEMIYEVINLAVPNMLSPKTTASWEQGLTAISKGKVTKDYYLDKMNNYIIQATDIMKNTDYKADIIAKFTELKEIYPNINLNGSSEKNKSFSDTSLICPKCGNSITKTPWGYGCSNYKAGCKWNVPDIGEDQVQKLITEKRTDKIKGLKNKSGKSYECTFVLDDNNDIQREF